MPAMKTQGSGSSKEVHQNGAAIVIAAPFLLIAFLTFAPIAHAATTITSTITTDTTWTVAQSPYIVQFPFTNAFNYTPLTVVAGATLTIEPGVVIKFDSYNGMEIHGALNVLGTDSQPIYFTSIADDTVGGDSDGVVTTPTDTQWTHLEFENGSTGNLDHIVVRYGGQQLSAIPNTGIENNGGTVVIDHAHLSHNGYDGLAQFSGTTHVSHSEFDHHQVGINHQYPGGTLTIDTSNIHDNGYAGVDQSFGITNITDSDIHDNNIGISSGFDGTVSVHGSSIHGNGLGISKSVTYDINNNPIDTGNAVDARNNWWGNVTGPVHTSNPSGTGDGVDDLVTFVPFLTSDPFATACTVNCNDNVLFLPGIEASRLYRPARPDEAPDTMHRLWEPGSDLDAQNLILNPDGTSVRADVFTRHVIDEAYVPAAGPNIYKSFIDQMNTLKSTGKIEDWSDVPYDWRLSLDDILNGGTKIGDNISYIATSSDPYVLHELMRLASSSRTGKVTIIAHSNGGLVAKALMIKLGPTAAQYVDKIIFVAVPQVGTPAAVGALLHGYDQGITTKVSDSAMRQLGHDSPAAYNLLPSFNYFTYVDDPVATFDTATLPDWVSRYGATVHSKDRLHTFLTSAYERVDSSSTDTIDPVQLNDTLLTQAESVHASLDAWIPPSGVQVIQIAGWGIPTTLKGIEYASTTKSIFCSGICAHGLGLTASTTIDGDGTVVVPSALWMSTTTGVVNYWVDLNKYNNFFRTGNIPRYHKDIFEVDGLLSFISDTIVSATHSLSTYIYLSTQAPSSTGTRLRYSLHSPLTLDLYDDQGRHTGVSTTTGEVEEQIPGTYYMRFGDVKYIFSDASSSVHIMMDGYAPGTFTFNVDQYSGDTRTASTTFQNIPTTASTTVTIDTQSDITTLSPMQIDTDGDGIVDATLTSKLNDTVTLDTTPPEIQITFATSTNSLAFIGIDDSGTVFVTSTTTYPTLKKNQKDYKGIVMTTVTARDEAGNTSALVYTEKLPFPKQRETITLQELAYNGATTTIASTTVSYKWRIKDGIYKLFASYIHTTATSTESHYRPKKNVTIIMTKPQDVDDTESDDDTDIRPTKLTLPGMVVPYIRTEKSRVIIGY